MGDSPGHLAEMHAQKRQALPDSPDPDHSRPRSPLRIPARNSASHSARLRRNCSDVGAVSTGSAGPNPWSVIAWISASECKRDPSPGRGLPMRDPPTRAAPALSPPPNATIPTKSRPCRRCRVTVGRGTGSPASRNSAQCAQFFNNSSSGRAVAVFVAPEVRGPPPALLPRHPSEVRRRWRSSMVRGRASGCRLRRWRNCRRSRSPWCSARRPSSGRLELPPCRWHHGRRFLSAAMRGSKYTEDQHSAYRCDSPTGHNRSSGFPKAMRLLQLLPSLP